MRQKNILIAYFSHKGENYSNGSIVKLEKGNTERAAEILAKVTGGDLFEIRREKKYPFSYKECVSESRRELQENARPKLAEDIDITGYDEIYLGFPNWCGTMPMPVWTFLENHDFTGKRVFPFCTNEGSGMGKSEADLIRLLPGIEAEKGLPIHGSSVDTSEEEIKAWVMGHE